MLALQPGLAPAGVPTPTREMARIDGSRALDDSVTLWPWRGVTWTVSYVGLLAYIFAITTYRLPIATVSMVVAIAGLLFQRDRFRFPPLMVWMLAFLIWATLGFFQTEFVDASWKQLEILLKLGLVTLVTVNALRTAAQLRFFTIFFLACFALYPVRGALFNYYIYGQKYWGRAIWQFAYGNPNDLAAYCLLHIALCAAVVVSDTNVWLRRAALLGLGMLPVLIFLTQSRGALISLGIFIAAVIFGHRKQLSKLFGKAQRRRVWVALAVVSVAVVILAPNSVWRRIGGLAKLTSVETIKEADEDRSAEQRFEIWKVAWRITQDHPVLGVGIGAYPFQHSRYVRFVTFNWFAAGQRDSHSTYLLVLAETGFPGLLIFLVMIGSVLAHAGRVRRRARDRLPRAALQLYYLQIGLIAFLLAGLFGSFAYLHFLYIYLALLWARAVLTSQQLMQLDGGEAALWRGRRSAAAELATARG